MALNSEQYVTGLGGERHRIIPPPMATITLRTIDGKELTRCIDDMRMTPDLHYVNLEDGWHAIRNAMNAERFKMQPRGKHPPIEDVIEAYWFPMLLPYPCPPKTVRAEPIV